MFGVHAQVSFDSLPKVLEAKWRHSRCIENADATLPHLEVLLHLGSSGGVHGSLQFFAFGLRSLFSSVRFLGGCG